MGDCSAALMARLRQASAAGQRLCVRGSGSYHSHTGETNSALQLNVAGHCGIVSYEPSEMVVTVRTGTPVRELEALLAEQGQRLGFECPLLADGATIGGALAMGYCGSSRPFQGAMRDYVLGVRMLNGLGEDLHFGGQVMKNVAGYDLPRLMVGSRGRLGLLLEVSLRTLPLTEHTLSLRFDYQQFGKARAFTSELIGKAEPLSGASYYRHCLYLRFSGREASLLRLQKQLGGEPFDHNWWQALRHWRMPWGSPQQLSYREAGHRQPQCGGAWLADWNGGLIWSEAPEPTARIGGRPGLPLTQSGLHSELEQRLRRAFDPAGLFAAAAL